MKTLHVGFTGTRHGMTKRQLALVEHKLESLQIVRTVVLHHGDCIGADAQADNIAKFLGIKRIIHPPDNTAKRAFCKGEEILETKPYLIRNHDIVDDSEFLIAAPKSEDETLRSGTWATVRYYRRKTKNVGGMLFIAYPTNYGVDRQ